MRDRRRERGREIGLHNSNDCFGEMIVIYPQWYMVSKGEGH